MHIDTFDLDHVNSFGSDLVHFSHNRAVTRNTAHHRAKRMEIWASRVYVVYIRLLLSINMSKSFVCHPVHFNKIGS